MNSGFYPQIEYPNNMRPQQLSQGYQAPFYFGGSQVLVNLTEPNISGSGLNLVDSNKKSTKKNVKYFSK